MLKTVSKVAYVSHSGSSYDTRTVLKEQHILFSFICRYYGYCVANIYDLVAKECRKYGDKYPATGRYLKIRLDNLLDKLSKCEYNYGLHADFTQDIVNKYGLLNGVPDSKTMEGAWLNDIGTLRLLIGRALRKKEEELCDMLIVLDCLCFMAHEDKKPLIIW